MSLYTVNSGLNVGVNLNNYELNVISKEKDSENKKLKKYSVNGTDYVGAYENETFEIQFKNNSWNRVQVRISIDGTDVITGKEADLKPAGEMWLVEAYGTINLKAWPETSKGGASFIFGKVEDSVAKHTHGNTESKGIISAAVFVEQPVTFNYTYQRSWNDPWGGPLYGGIRLTSGGGSFNSTGGGTFGSTVNNMTTDYTLDSCSLESSAAVGAGEYADQEIQKVAGLKAPLFATVLMVKYTWWTQLKTDLRKLGFNVTNADIGFPGEVKETKMIDLGSTPKKGKQPKPTKKPKKKYIELERFVNA